ncbi:hypothetical protein [Parasitella parasitica]|uniref:Uncharacterized protein n=1 Tax=Parasitella parasitica TaxID=35722 RepID=A0A0B7N8Z3_9FUNG|nr:hypothetical protein [Parasitella parasitica]
MIESCFTKYPKVEAVIGQNMSKAIKKRKNQVRHVPGLEQMEHVKFGSKLDLIFRQLCSDHQVALEFGGSEAGSLNEKSEARELKTVGFIHSGLSSTLQTYHVHIKSDAQQKDWHQQLGITL